MDSCISQPNEGQKEAFMFMQSSFTSHRKYFDLIFKSVTQIILFEWQTFKPFNLAAEKMKSTDSLYVFEV